MASKELLERLNSTLRAENSSLAAEVRALRADVAWVARRTDRWGGLATVDDSVVLDQARRARLAAMTSRGEDA